MTSATVAKFQVGNHQKWFQSFLLLDLPVGTYSQISSPMPFRACRCLKTYFCCTEGTRVSPVSTSAKGFAKGKINLFRRCIYLHFFLSLLLSDSVEWKFSSVNFDGTPITTCSFYLNFHFWGPEAEAIFSRKTNMGALF